MGDVTNQVSRHRAALLALLLVVGCGQITPAPAALLESDAGAPLAPDDARTDGGTPPQGSADAQSSERPSVSMMPDAGGDLTPEAPELAVDAGGDLTPEAPELVCSAAAYSMICATDLSPPNFWYCVSGCKSASGVSAWPMGPTQSCSAGLINGAEFVCVEYCSYCPTRR